MSQTIGYKLKVATLPLAQACIAFVLLVILIVITPVSWDNAISYYSAPLWVVPFMQGIWQLLRVLYGCTMSTLDNTRTVNAIAIYFGLLVILDLIN